MRGDVRKFSRAFGAYVAECLRVIEKEEAEDAEMITLIENLGSEARVPALKEHLALAELFANGAYSNEGLEALLSFAERHIPGSANVQIRIEHFRPFSNPPNH